MSVSDPLLKKLKGFIYELRTESGLIKDDHRCLQGFCETLEQIFRKGLKESGGFWGLNRRDYWHWIESLPDYNNGKERVNPIYGMVVSHVKDSNKVRTTQGRGRYFLRIALQKKILTVPIEQLKRGSFCEAWYAANDSILGNEILTEILMSLLYEATEIKFHLNVRNCTYLDESWELSIYRQYEFVPCDDLGIKLHYTGGRALVTHVEPGSVAEEDKKVEPGDVLDDLYGESLRGVRKGKMQNLLKEHQGMPIYMSVVKGRRADGSMYGPIAALIRDCHGYPKLQELLSTQQPSKAKNSDARIPPHAQLPEDEYDEVPVHNNDKAVYRVVYIGRVEIGTDGGVKQVEAAIEKALKLEPLNKKFLLELGETEVIITNPKTNEVEMKHSYTQVSACGRRVDCVSNFCYIAGETTCTLAQKFVAHVFKAECDEECRTILCSIAQGFERTHWFI